MNDFETLCYKYVKKIPKGKVATYKTIAKCIGTNTPRAVGTAMKKSKMPDFSNTIPQHLQEVPCHRVVLSSKKVGEYIYGEEEKIKLLEKEGIHINKNKTIPNEYFIEEKELLNNLG